MYHTQQQIHIVLHTDILEDFFHPGFQPSPGHSHLQVGGGVGIPFGGGVVGIMGDGGGVDGICPDPGVGGGVGAGGAF